MSLARPFRLALAALLALSSTAAAAAPLRARALVAPAAALARVAARPLDVRRGGGARMAIQIDAKSDWFSTTALLAENLLAQPAPDRADLEVGIDALAYAVRAHKRLQTRLEEKAREMRAQNGDWFVIEGLDH